MEKKYHALFILGSASSGSAQFPWAKLVVVNQQTKGQMRALITYTVNHWQTPYPRFHPD